MIKFIHHYWAYLVLAMFTILILNSLWALINKRSFDYTKDFRLALFTLIVFDIQILIGLVAYFTSPYFEGIKNGHMGEYMKNASDRLIVVEHPSMMLLALLFIHYGFSRLKKLPKARQRFLDIIIFYGVAFILILARIPWNKF
jgi:VIT1/CCC1 family predicted Fe2+/Mn2+ transporter